MNLEQLLQKINEHKTQNSHSAAVYPITGITEDGELLQDAGMGKYEKAGIKWQWGVPFEEQSTEVQEYFNQVLPK